MTNKILVAYATKCGSTADVAAAIAQALCAQGAQAEARDIREVRDLSGYDGVVLGSAVRMGKALGSARRFANKHAETLTRLPAAYFCVCGGMKEDTPENRTAAKKALAGLVEAAPPVSVGLFAGCFDYSKMEPLFRFMLSRGGDAATAEGDYRDWDAIRSWAEGLPVAMGLA